jgi:membrane protein involved in colicin uptake
VGDGRDPELVETAESNTGDATDAVQETPQDTTAKAKETVQSAEQAAEEATGEAENKTQVAADNAESKAEEAVADAKAAGSEAADEAQKTTEKVSDKVEESAPKKSRWSAYIPSLQRNKSQAKKKDGPAGTAEDETMIKSWSSYLSVGGGQKDGSSSNTNSQKKGWSAYIPSGQAFSSYIPSKDALSAFAGSHYRDPAKSYAEQLYDFSKTPVGAASLSGQFGKSDPFHSLFSANRDRISCNWLQLC